MFTADQIIMGLMSPTFNNGQGYPIDVAMNFAARQPDANGRTASQQYEVLLASRTPEVLAAEAANRFECASAGVAG